MEKIKRFRLKPGETLWLLKPESFWTFVHEDAVKGYFGEIADGITVNVAFPEDLTKWDDYNYILVVDEDSGQPYYPFYNYMEGKEKAFPFLAEVIKGYNRWMGSKPEFEEVEE